jgi:hypothetical protein
MVDLTSHTTKPVDLEREDHKRILSTLRRQCNANGKRASTAGTGKSPTFGYETTIGDIARALKMKPQLVADHLEDAWLVILDREPGQPIESWGVSEDGD